MNNQNDLEQLFTQMNALHVVVIGDVMMDNYFWGKTERMSPEAPVAILNLRKKESRLGGAANVALNCKSLGAKVTLASVLGNDSEGQKIIELTEKAQINTQLLFKSNHRQTTTKTRIINLEQHLLRIDDEITDDLITEDEHQFIDAIMRFLQIEKPNAVIFEDYNKGVLKENVIHKIIAHCNEIGIITTVDPKKNNFFSYKNVTLFKPNLKEIREGINLPIQHCTINELEEAHSILIKNLNNEISFFTLSNNGVFVQQKQEKSKIFPAHLRKIIDVSGAGDTVIAVATIVYTLTKDAYLMAAIANISGGLVCEKVGVEPIEKQSLLNECIHLLNANELV